MLIKVDDAILNVESICKENDSIVFHCGSRKKHKKIISPNDLSSVFTVITSKLKDDKYFDLDNYLENGA